MMDSWTESTSLYTKALEANGFAQERQNIYLESTKAKMEQFKVTLTTIFQNTVSSEGINAIVTMGTKIIEVFGGVAKVIGIVPVLMGTVIATMSIFGKMNIWGGMTKFASQFSVALNTIQLNAEATGVRLGTLSAVTQAFGLTAVGTATKVVLLNTAITMGLSFAIMGVITLVGKLINHAETVKKEMEELNSSIKQQTDSLKEINTLASQYDELTKAIKESDKVGKDSTKQKGELLDVQKQIANLLPETTTEINKEGEAYAKNKDIIQEVIDKKKEDLILDTESAILSIGNLDKEVDKYKEALDAYNKLKEARSKNQPIKKDIPAVAQGMVADSEIPILTDKETIDKMKEYRDTLNASEKIIDAYNVNVEKFNKLTGTQKYKVIDLTDVTNINTEEVTKNNKEIEKQITSLEALQATFDTTSSKISTFNGYLKELTDNHKLSGDSIQEIVKSYPELIGYLDNEKTLRIKLQDIIKKEKDIQLQTFIDMAKNDETYYNSKLKTNVELVNKIKDSCYGADLKNYSSLNEAKLAMEEELKNRTKIIWDNYFNSLKDKSPADMVQDILDPKAGIKKVQGQIEKAKSQLSTKTFDNIVGKFIKADVGKIDLNFDSSDKSKSSSTKTDQTSQISVSDKTDTFILKMNDINDTLSKSDKSVKNLQDKIKSLFDMGDKNSLSEAIKEQNNLITEYDKKLSATDKAKFDLTNGKDGISSKLKKQIESEFPQIKKIMASQFKGQSLLELSENDRQKISEQMFPTKDFGKGDNASKAKEQYEASKKQFEQYLKSDISAYQTNLEKVNNDKKSTLNDKSDAFIKLGEMQAKNLIFSFDKTISDNEEKISLIGSIDSDEERQKVLEYTENIGTALKSKLEAINKTLPTLKAKIDSGKATSGDKSEYTKALEDKKNTEKAIVDNNEGTVSQSQEILDKQFTKSLYANKKSLQDVENKMSLLDESDIEGKKKLLSDKITLLKTQAEIMEENYIKLMDEVTSSNSAEGGLITDDEQQKLDDYRQSIDDVTKSIHDLKKETKDTKTSLVSSYRDLQDELYNAVKAEREKAKTEELKQNKTKLTELSEQYEGFIDETGKYVEGIFDPLNDELKKYEKELKDLQDDTVEKTDKLTALQKERDLWSKDNSVLGVSKVKELDKQIKEQQKEVNIANKQNQIDKKKDEIQTKQDEYDLKKKELSSIEDEITKKYDGYVDKTGKVFAGLLSESSIYQEVNKKMELSQEQILTYLTSNNEKYKLAGGILADAFTDEMTLKITNGIKAMKALLNTQIVDPYNKTVDKIINNPVNSGSSENRGYEGVLNRLGAFSAESGGMTSAWGSEGKFAMLHEKELILNKFDTSNILKVIDITRNLVGNFKVPQFAVPNNNTNSQKIELNQEINNYNNSQFEYDNSLDNTNRKLLRELQRSGLSSGRD